MSERSTDQRAEPSRFFFLHMQKTAGTALWRRLKQHFEPSSVYPGPDDGAPPASVLSVEHLLDRWTVRRAQIAIVTGHFPLCTLELLGGSFTTLTILRDPVERTLSALRDLQARSPELRGAPLELIYDDPVRASLLRNHMVQMLSLTVDEMSEGALSRVELTREHLDRAQERLMAIDVVGFQDRFEAFCAELTRRFAWDLGPPIFMNRTSPVPISDDLRRRVADDSALDVELYEFALRQEAG